MLPDSNKMMMMMTIIISVACEFSQVRLFNPCEQVDYNSVFPAQLREVETVDYTVQYL